MTPMEIDLRSLTEGLNLFTWEATASDLDIEREEVGLNGPARVALTVVKTGETLTAHGEVAFGLKLACCRCLEPVDQAVDVAVNLVFQKGRPGTLDDLKDVNDTDLIFYEENTVSVDVASHIRDVIILETPMKPLCSESCAGLCPICGANRNRESCSCRREETDPRWEALRQFKTQ
jgi:uncharacterized protein